MRRLWGEHPHRRVIVGSGLIATLYVLAVAAGDLTLYPLIRLRLGTVLPVVVAVLAVWTARGMPPGWWRSTVPLTTTAFVATMAVVLPVAGVRAPDPETGRAEVQGVLVGLAIVVTVLALVRGTIRGLVAMRHGWAAALALSVVVATGELVTDRHLWVDPGLAWAEQSHTIVAGAFRNPNDFAIALTAMISGTLAAVATTGGRRRAALLMLVTAGVAGVVLTESRSGLLVLAVVLAVHALAALRRRSTTRLPRRALALGAALGGALLAASFLVPALAARNPIAAVLRSAAQPGTARSDQLRLDLIRAGLRYLRGSDGFGTGAASFEVLLANDLDPGVSTRTWLHNSFLELTLQYGVPAALALGLLLAVLVIALVRTRAPQPARAVVRAEATGALVAFVALGCASATVVTMPMWWLMLVQAIAAAWWAARPDVETSVRTSSGTSEDLSPRSADNGATVSAC